MDVYGCMCMCMYGMYGVFVCMYVCIHACMRVNALVDWCMRDSFHMCVHVRVGDCICGHILPSTRFSRDLCSLSPVQAVDEPVAADASCSPTPGHVTLTATFVAIVAIEPDFRAVQRVLALTHTGQIPVPHAARLLKCSEDVVRDLLAADAGSYALKQSLLRLTRLLASDGHSAAKTVTQRPSHLSGTDARLLAHLESTVTLWPVDELPSPGPTDAPLSTHESNVLRDSLSPDSDCDTDADASDAATLKCMHAIHVDGQSNDRQPIEDGLRELQPHLNLTDPSAPCRRESNRVRTRHEYCVTKKQPQLLWILHQLCRHWPRTAALRVYDVCGGRGDLGLCIARTFPLGHVTVLDANALSLAAGRRRAAAVGLTNIDFACVDLLHWSAPAVDACGSRTASTPPTTLFIGLHARGALSDTILALAVRHDACFFVVPCCFGKHDHLPAGQSWCAHLPDALPLPEVAALGACGTPACASAVAAVAPSAASSWSRALLRLAESPTRTVSVRAMHIINSLRLHWVQQATQTRCMIMRDSTDSTDAATSREHMRDSSNSSSAPISTLPTPRLLCFDEAASLRNFVLARLT
jgi:hypothetical protein